MKRWEYLSEREADTVQVGLRIAKTLKAGDIICLTGDLGTGKTTLVKGIAKGLKINPRRVNSPTFVLMNCYEGKLQLFHFDFYRLNRQQEIAAIGCDEFFYDDGVAVIEWAERMGGLLPKENLTVKLKFHNATERLLTFSARGKRYESILKGLRS